MKIALFLQILTLIFITLKLTNQIAWSWLWVLSPLWISIGLGLISLAILYFVFYLPTAHKRK
jgi:hypothetical protein